TRPAAMLLRDDLFAAPVTPLPAGDALAASDRMKAFADTALRTNLKARDMRWALIDAMYRPDMLQLQYDASTTRSAAEAFDTRSGNCLSLVIMTAALARHLGLEVTFQSVLGEDSYSRSGEMLFASGHVNLALGRPRTSSIVSLETDRALVVDFMPQAQIAKQRVMPLREATVRAMYMNNRAAETLSTGETAQAYWWAREAVLLDPAFLPGINTLAVIYQRSGHLRDSEAALRHVLAADPRQVSALGNLLRVLEIDGRIEEARAVASRLGDLQPHRPFEMFDRGRAALDAGQVRTARDLFAAELRHQPFQHEVHYWMAVAEHHLGDDKGAVRHLAMALENSTTRNAHALYAGKLDRLRHEQQRTRSP
ncbi:MAG: tetratricopeptide repeat protein, partial [Chitinophagaceae bacterium]|nr:tetratricopeptide repeat protein [Rubrivivax sp.]